MRRHGADWRSASAGSGLGSAAGAAADAGAGADEDAEIAAIHFASAARALVPPLVLSLPPSPSRDGGARGTRLRRRGPIGKAARVLGLDDAAVGALSPLLFLPSPPPSPSPSPSPTQSPTPTPSPSQSSSLSLSPLTVTSSPSPSSSPLLSPTQASASTSPMASLRSFGDLSVLDKPRAAPTVRFSVCALDGGVTMRAGDAAVAGGACAPERDDATLLPAWAVAYVRAHAARLLALGAVAGTPGVLCMRARAKDVRRAKRGEVLLNVTFAPTHAFGAAACGDTPLGELVATYDVTTQFVLLLAVDGDGDGDGDGGEAVLFAPVVCSVV